MSRSLTPPSGGSWKSRHSGSWLSSVRTGGSWILASSMVVAVFAGSLAVSTETQDVADFGLLGTSMVEMLAGEDTAGSVTLEELRSIVLVDPGAVGDGSGIDVALIDTGVAPVAGLDGRGKILHGPDLSNEGAYAEVAYLDTYGHGTHMAGIIAGTRDGARGVAPGARLISVKVAGNDGITSVPQVIAAIDWVVEHKNSDGLNIRVLNLSLGQSEVATHIGDELSASVERAWRAGIFVVVAAGNDGETQAHLDSPAIDPFVLAVGAADSMSGKRNFLDVPAWSGLGDGLRNPDVVSAGRSILSYRVPGSTLDLAYPTARVGEDFFLGSGTSQATAAVSGAAAAMLSTNPRLTNDDLKATFRNTADDLRREPEITSGKGIVDAAAGLARPKTRQSQLFATAGLPTPQGPTWSGGEWSGAGWSGAGWSGAAWSGGAWSGAGWSGAGWSGAGWSGAGWSGGAWSGAGWSGAGWSGAGWSGGAWSGTGWSN